MKSESLMTLVPLILLIFIMYFLLIRPQKKREKQVAIMRNAIKVGDDIITIGGICGKVVKTKDETLIIQVGADKTKFEVMRWSISKVVTDAAAAPTKKSVKAEDDVEEETSKKSLPKKMKKSVDAPVKEVEDIQSPTDEIIEVEAEVVTMPEEK